MINDCVFDAWKQYIRTFGERAGAIDHLEFWRLRWYLSAGKSWLGDPTPIEVIPDLVTLLSARKQLFIRRIELEVYTLDDFHPESSIYVYNKDDRVGPLYMLDGMFYSLDSKHAYYSPRRNPKDWVCMAISLRRLNTYAYH